MGVQNDYLRAIAGQGDIPDYKEENLSRNGKLLKIIAENGTGGRASLDEDTQNMLNALMDISKCIGGESFKVLDFEQYDVEKFEANKIYEFNRVRATYDNLVSILPPITIQGISGNGFWYVDDEEGSAMFFVADNPAFGGKTVVINFGGDSPAIWSFDRYGWLDFPDPFIIKKSVADYINSLDENLRESIYNIFYKRVGIYGWQLEQG